MKRQMVAAPTPLMARGRKMADLDSFSPWALSRSARVATPKPMATVIAGTTAIHSRVLPRVIRKSLEPSRSV
jgi:hypothetical protein